MHDVGDPRRGPDKSRFVKEIEEALLREESRPRRAQRKGRAGRAAGRARDRRRARRGGPARRAGRARGSLDELPQRRARRDVEPPAPLAAARAFVPTSRWPSCGATSTRASRSSRRATTTRSCSRWRACAGWGASARPARAIGVDEIVPAPARASSRSRLARATSGSPRSRERDQRRRDAVAGCAAERARGERARRELPHAGRRPRRPSRASGIAHATPTSGLPDGSEWIRDELSG